jgi:hypothetical protein
MKMFLHLSSLIIAGGYAAAELAETMGAHLPTLINIENALIAFICVLTAAILTADYARRAGTLSKPANAPAAATASATRRPLVGARRRVRAIRRGAEAARLATPPSKVTVFPKRRSVECDRAA